MGLTTSKKLENVLESLYCSYKLPCILFNSIIMVVQVRWVRDYLSYIINYNWHYNTCYIYLKFKIKDESNILSEAGAPLVHFFPSSPSSSTFMCGVCEPWRP